jgi:predicted ATPase
MELRETGMTLNTRSKRLGTLQLRRIKLDGFKAVKSSGYVDLKPLTLFIGRNGAGKSSFVEALQWLQDAFFKGLLDATESRFRSYQHLRNKRSSQTKLHLELESSTATPVYYDLTVGKVKGPSFRPIVLDESLRFGRAKGQKVIISTAKGSKGPVWRKVVGGTSVREADSLGVFAASINAHPSIRAMSEWLRGVVALRLSPTSMRWESSLEQRPGVMLDEEGARLPALLASLNDTQRAWVKDRISTAIAGLRGVSVKKTEPSRGYVRATEVMKWPGGSKSLEIPAWMLSEGTRRMTALFALLAARPRPSLLLVEEIENGLDPWTLEHIFAELRTASVSGTQVVVTTHSPFLLDHVAPAEVIHVRRSKGESSYKPIAEYKDVTQYGDIVAPGAMYIAGYYSERDR